MELVPKKNRTDVPVSKLIANTYKLLGGDLVQSAVDAVSSVFGGKDDSMAQSARKVYGMLKKAADKQPIKLRGLRQRYIDQITKVYN